MLERVVRAVEHLSRVAVAGQVVVKQDGQLGNITDVINFYLNQTSNQVEKVERDDIFSGNHFRSIYMCDKNLSEKNDYRFDEEICVKLSVKLPENNGSLELAMRLMDKNKKAVFTIHEKLEDLIHDGHNADILVSIPPKFLTPDRYSWVMCINLPGVSLYDLQDDILPFTIIDTGSDFARYDGLDYGSVFANYSINKI